MKTLYWDNLLEHEKSAILSRSTLANNNDLSDTVKSIINNVINNGDNALYEYSQKFDGVVLDNLLVSSEEYKAADNLEQQYKDAIISSYENISYYHNISCPKEFSYTKDGITLGKIYRPIEKVGLYIPGGTATLVSTLMMLAIPAQIAGCEEKILVTPPMKDGSITPAILFAAKQCGIDKIYKVGGAQAIAALAYGTATIPKVHKIFGPGNKYVTEAKLQVSVGKSMTAIDMPAGPSEVLVIADKNANPDFVASDLLAQAEHDIDAHVVLVTTDSNFADKVGKALLIQQSSLSRPNIIKQSLAKSAIIIAGNIDECFSISNRYAPEHLILHLDNAEQCLKHVKNAGSVFVGQWSPESAGDYSSGTNHVLPTYGYANMYSGLDVISFMKAISFQNLSIDGIQKLGPTIENLAHLEGLDAHKNAVTIRLMELKKGKI
jgi:histidinol dehydrogenase